MEQLNNTTELIGLQDKNIHIRTVWKDISYILINATLDYKPGTCSHCRGTCIKYDFQKPSKIPFIEVGGYPTLVHLKKRRFQCRNCKKVQVAQTNLVKKNCQISEQLRQKVTQSLLERQAITQSAKQLGVSTSTVFRKLDQFNFKEDFSTLPEVLSWDEFSYAKGKLAFIAQDYDTGNILTILDNRRQTTIRNHFFRYSKEARNKVKYVTMDMAGSYMPLVKKLFPKAQIVLDRFHIVQHLARAFNRIRIQLMNQLDRKSLAYRTLKSNWKLFLKESRTLSDSLFYSRTFNAHLTHRELVAKTLDIVPQLKEHYDLYQLLLFHFQERNTRNFFGLIDETFKDTHPLFKTVFRTFRHLKYAITNALEQPYSNARLEATNKIIKDIKRNAFGFRNFENFKKRIFIALNFKKEKTKLVLSRVEL